MKLFKTLYFWIVVALFCGIVFGLSFPKTAELMEPLGISFIKLIKMLIGPLVFCTVVIGIVQTGSLKKLGKISLKTIIYFEIVSSIALLIGWSAANIIKPGAFIHANPASLDTTHIEHFIQNAEKLSFSDFLQNIIPTSLIEPFLKSDMLQTLFIAILFGIVLVAMGEEKSKLFLKPLTWFNQLLFQLIRLIMYAAPLGVFGAMAFTIAKFGGDLLLPLLKLIGSFYLTGLIFVLFILGAISKFVGFSIIDFLRYMLPELFLVLGTSSSESALPQLMQKLEILGCKKETIGVVVPTGYSFNLDGTNIYITLAALFIAQAFGIHLTFAQEFTLFITAMLTSKGAAGITGAGFITLAATLSVLPTIPVVGLVLILGIDRFMSEARSLINYIGNGVAALVISRWEKEISASTLNQKLKSLIM